MEWRAKWADCWEDIQTCSKACRKLGIRSLDRQLEQLHLAYLDAAPAGGVVCPSRAPKSLRPDAWAPLMNRAHAAARRLAHRGELVLVHHNTILDPSHARTPYALCKTKP